MSCLLRFLLFCLVFFFILPVFIVSAGTTYKDMRTSPNHILRFNKGQVPFLGAYLLLTLIESGPLLVWVLSTHRFQGESILRPLFLVKTRYFSGKLVNQHPQISNPIEGPDQSAVLKYLWKETSLAWTEVRWALVKTVWKFQFWITDFCQLLLLNLVTISTFVPGRVEVYDLAGWIYMEFLQEINDFE